MSSLEGDLYLRQISDFHFELIVIVQKQYKCTTATNSSLGVVMGGDKCRDPRKMDRCMQNKRLL